MPGSAGVRREAGYRQVWSSAMGRSFLNSGVVTLPAVLIPILIAGFAAYAFTFMDFRGRKILCPGRSSSRRRSTGPATTRFIVLQRYFIRGLTAAAVNG